MVYTGSDEFDWDDANAEHIHLGHGIEPESAMEAMSDPDRQALDVRRVGNERRATIVGMTERGDLLAVVYTMRAGRMRVVTARHVTERERRRYRRGRKKGRS
jgi:hypothetical protein